jgi:hypothetical protein
MMDSGLRLFSVCTIPITLVLFFLMARLAGREMAARKRIYLMGIIMPAAMLLVNAVFLFAGFTPLCGGVSFLFFFVGLVLGYLAGKKARMGIRDGVVMAKRSSLPLILWAVSYAVTQLFTTVIPSTGAGIGVAMMFLSTGAAIGMNGLLLVRYRQIRA